MLTYEEIEKKRRSGHKLTEAERTLLIVCQASNAKPEKVREKFKREAIELIMNNPKATEEDRQILREELSRMSADSKNLKS